MIFYFLAALLIFLALTTVLTKHIFRSAIYLMGVLTLSAGLYLLLGAEFLAGVQILVYVGGIVILLVFAVMLTRSKDLLEDRPSLKRKIIGALVAFGFFSISTYGVLNSNLIQNASLPKNPASISDIGHALLSPAEGGYIVPFELISVLLLTVLIAGIVLARKEKV